MPTVNLLEIIQKLMAENGSAWLAGLFISQKCKEERKNSVTVGSE